jgi:hypothetical protein
MHQYLVGIAMRSLFAPSFNWLNELITEANTNTESIATRERCSVRKVNMTISLAFLAPDLVKAAIDGRLPHGLGVVRLADLPAEWSRQRQMLGLPPFEPVSADGGLWLPGNRISEARDRSAKSPLAPRVGGLRDSPVVQNPAKCGPLRPPTGNLRKP